MYEASPKRQVAGWRLVRSGLQTLVVVPCVQTISAGSRFYGKDGDFTGGFQFLMRLGLFQDSRPVSEHGVTFCCGMTARGVRQDELKAT